MQHERFVNALGFGLLGLTVKLRRVHAMRCVFLFVEIEIFIFFILLFCYLFIVYYYRFMV